MSKIHYVKKGGSHYECNHAVKMNPKNATNTEILVTCKNCQRIICID